VLDTHTVLIWDAAREHLQALTSTADGVGRLLVCVRVVWLEVQVEG
jgi:hypothetical protein